MGSPLISNLISAKEGRQYDMIAGIPFSYLTEVTGRGLHSSLVNLGGGVKTALLEGC